MKGHPATEGQIRGRLSHIYSVFSSHGKTISNEEIAEVAKKRLESGPPYLEEMFQHFEARDYEMLLQVLDYDTKSAPEEPETEPEEPETPEDIDIDPDTAPEDDGLGELDEETAEDNILETSSGKKSKKKKKKKSKSSSSDLDDIEL